MRKCASITCKPYKRRPLVMGSVVKNPYKKICKTRKLEYIYEIAFFGTEK
jgi:hypothetical protein